MGLQLWIDGIPAQFITGRKYGNLSWSTGADGGCLQATWTMAVPRKFHHPSLLARKLVQIKDGGINVFAGLLNRPDPGDDDGLSCTALGLSTEATRFLCFDSLYNSTSIPNTAINRAISDGLQWKPFSVSSSPFGSADTTTSDLNTLTSLLNAYGDANGMRWGVDATATPYMRLDPTAPDWYLMPSTAQLGLAEDDYASNLYGRYAPSSPAGPYQTVTVEDAVARAQVGRQEAGVDLTSLGQITSTAATSALTGLLTKGSARLALTDGVDAATWQLTTPGGQPAHLPFVRGGQLVRHFGVLNEQGQPLPYVDWVIGETDLDAGAKNIGLAPVGLPARTLGDVLTLPAAAA